jgi:hypothetical protein
MKRLLLGLSIVIGAWMLSPTPEADAMGSDRWARGHNHHARHQNSQSRNGVPELDPSAAGSAIVLLLGGMAYIASRRREEDVA